MAHTYNIYNGRGCDFHEGMLAYAIAITLAECAEVHKHDEKRYSELMKQLSEWRKAVHSSGVGMLSLDLDRRLGGDREKEDTFLECIERAKGKVRSFGGVVPAEYLARVVAVKGYNYTHTEGAVVIGVLEAIRSLVRPDEDEPR